MRYAPSPHGLPHAPSPVYLSGDDERGPGSHGDGPISAHLRDVAGLPPDIMRVDMVRFVATIEPSGRIIQPEHVTLHGDFRAELFALSGFGPRAEPSGADLLSWNGREDGRTHNLFTTPVEMAQLTSTGGPGPMIEFSRAAYVFQPGARVRLDFTAESGITTTTPLRFGVTLFLNLIRA